MEPVVGVFTFRNQAEEAAERLCEKGLEQITLLTPSDWQEKLHNVRTEDMEQRGMGAVLGCLVGCALGVAGGVEFGALATVILASGAGSANAVQLLGAAILGAAGAAAGWAGGRALERSFSDGLPKDDLYIYQGALRHGRSVVIAFTNKTQSVVAVRDVMASAGAESLDAACKRWWIRLRPAEDVPYRADGVISGMFCRVQIALKRTLHLRHPQPSERPR